MEETQKYFHCYFSPDVLEEAIEAFRALVATEDQSIRYVHLHVEINSHESWNHDHLTDFLVDYSRSPGSAFVYIVGPGYGQRFSLHVGKFGTQVRIAHESRSSVLGIQRIFDRHAAASYSPPPPPPAPPPPPPPKTFIGHGRSTAWRDLKDHLQDKQGYRVEAYETGARGGWTISEVLGELLDKTSFALLVMTAEDETADGAMRARQNVVHEAGLFQGRLGLRRAIILLEEGTEEFSNVAGVQYLPFAKGNIAATFGDVVSILRDQFPHYRP